jgi:hypothetical protein
MVKWRKFPVVKVGEKRENPGRWTLDPDPAYELPWNVSLFILEQIRPAERCNKIQCPNCDALVDPQKHPDDTILICPECGEDLTLEMEKSKRRGEKTT